MTRTLLALVLCLCAGRPAFALGVTRFAEIELVGPLSNVMIEARGGGRTCLEGTLVLGETRQVVLPIQEPDLGSVAPAITFDENLDPQAPRGSARFVGWRASLAGLEGLTPGLRARTRPALEETPVHVSSAAVLVLVAALVSICALRRRPLAALGVAIAAAAATYPLVHAPVRDLEAVVTLIDGDAQETTWRRVDAALDELVLDATSPDFQLACDPPDARVTWRVPLDPRQKARVEARDTRLFATRVFRVEENALARTSNGYAALLEAWLREEGQWRRLGPWDFGAPLPAPGQVEEPPAWLAAGLSQGVPMLVARAVSSAGGPRTWVRIAGL